MELKIYEKKRTGIKSDSKFPMLYVGKSTISFNEVSSEKLNLKKGSEILFASNNGTFYVANVTDSELRGYKLSVGNKSIRLQTSVAAFLKDSKIKQGHYTISGFAVFNEKSKLDFYELIYNGLN